MERCSDLVGVVYSFFCAYDFDLGSAGSRFGFTAWSNHICVAHRESRASTGRLQMVGSLLAVPQQDDAYPYGYKKRTLNNQTNKSDQHKNCCRFFA